MERVRLKALTATVEKRWKLGMRRPPTSVAS